MGAGPVTQAIHLPALATVRDYFTVRKVMDTDLKVAQAVADRAGAQATTSVSAVLEDPAVEVVAICSPHAFHAEQTIAACRAGKRAVLCEKPLTMSIPQAEEVAAVSAATGVPVIVGTMHSYDSAWEWAAKQWGHLEGSAHTIRSSIILPPNERFEDFSTEVTSRVEPLPVNTADANVRASIAHLGVMAVGMHNVPHLRSFLPSEAAVNVHHARGLLPPFGYDVFASAGDCQLDLLCYMYDTWHPKWTFEAIGDSRALRIEFTPSYVKAGSATATIFERDQSTTCVRTASNGYVKEWLHLYELALKKREPTALSAIVNDLRFAMNLAHSVADVILQEENHS